MRAATHLAHELNLNVVAEGVEDVDTWHALADLGCDIAQGFLLSRPKPAAELTEWLIRHTQVSGAPRVDIPARAQHQDEVEQEDQDDTTVDAAPVPHVHLLRRPARGRPAARKSSVTGKGVS